MKGRAGAGCEVEMSWGLVDGWHQEGMGWEGVGWEMFVMGVAWGGRGVGSEGRGVRVTARRGRGEVRRRVVWGWMIWGVGADGGSPLGESSNTIQSTGANPSLKHVGTNVRGLKTRLDIGCL